MVNYNQPKAVAKLLSAIGYKTVLTDTPKYVLLNDKGLKYQTNDFMLDVEFETPFFITNGETLIDWLMVKDYLANAKPRQYAITPNGFSQTEISTNVSELTIKTMHLSEYKVTKPDDSLSFSGFHLTADEYIDVLNLVKNADGGDTTGNVLQNIQFKKGGAVATDGSRMHHLALNTDIEEKASYTVNGSVFKAFSNIVKDSQAPVLFSFSGDYATLHCKGVTLTHKCCTYSNTYPQWEQIFPDTSTMKSIGHFNVKETLPILKLALKTANKRTFLGCFYGGTIATKNDDGVESTTKLQGLQANDFAFSVNLKFLVAVFEGLQKAKKEYINLIGTGSLSPLMFVGYDYDYRALVMPVQIR